MNHCIINCLLFSLLTLFISCNNDSANPTPTPDNQFAHSNQIFQANHGLEVDIGDPFGKEYKKELNISDGEYLQIPSGGIYSCQGCSYSLKSTLFSEGPEFLKGEYSIGVEGALRDADITLIDDPDPLGQGTTIATAVSGMMTVTGNSKSYMIEYDLMMSDGNSLIGNYVLGEWAYIDNRPTEEDIRLAFLVGTWDMESTTLDGNDRTSDWNGFTTTFTEFKSYEVQNSFDDNVWPAVGTWDFHGTEGSGLDIIVRSDRIMMNIISLDESTLTLDFVSFFPGVEGKWIFKFKR